MVIDSNVLQFIVIGVGVGIVVVGLLYVRYQRERTVLSASFDMVTLRVSLPKESQHQDNEQRQKGSEAIKEDIAAAELFFSTIAGLKKSAEGLRWAERFSFEIVNQHKLIDFYIAVPVRWKQFIIEQLHAQYPTAQAEELSGGYQFFSSKNVESGAFIVPTRLGIFPLRTFRKMEGDPLNALTNALSRLGEQDAASIQYIVHPAAHTWNTKASKVARELQQGKKLHDAMKKANETILHVVGRQLISIFTAPFSKKKQEEKERQQAYKLSPMEEEMVKGLEEKASRAMFEVTIRVVVSTPQPVRSSDLLRAIVSAFGQYNVHKYGNTLHGVSPRNQQHLLRGFLYRMADHRRAILDTEELASLFHLPLATTETPNIHWLGARKTAPPNNMPQEGIILGRSLYRGSEVLVRIKRDDRRRHVYMIGKSGSGKSFLLANMARQDILNGDGVCIIDPHGDLVEDILQSVPRSRADDVIFFDPADAARPMGLNLMEYDPKYPEQKTFVINEMINIFDKLYDLRQTGGPMFEQYMRNAMLLVMEDVESGSTLMEISKVLADPQFRAYKLSKCNNPVVKDFWTKEAEKAGGEAALANMVPYITSKLTQFVANDMMRPIIGQQESAFKFREIMDQKKILFINLSKGRLGDTNAYLIGLVVVGKILMAALSRTDMPQDKRSDFYLYIDEFQNFITDSIAIILSEARKYRLDLTIAHQYMGQLVKNNDTKIRDAVLGNVGTMMTFRIGPEDSEIFAKEFAPVVTEHDVLNVEKYSAYCKLLIDNEASRAFNMYTFPLEKGDHELAAMLKELSRLRYGRDRELVEEELRERTKKVYG